MANDEHQSAVWSHPELLGGEPTIRGTRVPFQGLLDHLDKGQGKAGFERFLDGFPTVTREMALAALEEQGKLDLIK